MGWWKAIVDGDWIDWLPGVIQVLGVTAAGAALVWLFAWCWRTDTDCARACASLGMTVVRSCTETSVECASPANVVVVKVKPFATEH